MVDTTLDLDVLCKRILNKNIEVLQACNQLDQKVTNCNDIINTSTVIEDKKTIMIASTAAMKTCTNHVNRETSNSSTEIGKMRIEMENIEKRTKQNLTEHNKSVDKLKSEVKKAENKGVSTINRLSNQKLYDKK